MIKILKYLIVLIFIVKIGTCCFTKSESDLKTSIRPTITTITIQQLSKSYDKDYSNF